MKLLRNREIRLYLWIAALTTLAAGGIAAFFSPAAGLAAALGCAGASVLFFLLTARRYREIERLAEYVRRMNTGRYPLEPDDNEEGELSILKSEIYKTAVTLKTQAEGLRAERNALSSAMSDISHQLKTPLTSMLVLTDLLHDGALPDAKRAEFTGRLKTQLERLQWLVSALLKLARFDAGAVRFRPAELSVRELVGRAAAPLMIPMELKEQELVLDIGRESVRCDAAWTAEALVNVLKNCVEHTPRGGTIAVGCEATPFYLKLTVADSGPGFAREDLPRVFRRFYRGRNAGEDSAGIGLAMAKSILEGQGAEIEARNVPLGGAFFEIRFYDGESRPGGTLPAPPDDAG